MNSLFLFLEKLCHTMIKHELLIEWVQLDPILLYKSYWIFYNSPVFVCVYHLFYLVLVILGAWWSFFCLFVLFLLLEFHFSFIKWNNSPFPSYFVDLWESIQTAYVKDFENFKCNVTGILLVYVFCYFPFSLKFIIIINEYKIINK